MDPEPGCGGCGSGDDQRVECQNTLRDIGILKVHWECWSDCNLSCRFCYRSRGAVLDNLDAKKLIGSVVYGGASQIVFAGGDPSLRRDLLELVEYSHKLHLKVEIQTNCHFVSAVTHDALLAADLVGVSIDGPTDEIHDKFRGKRSNFDRVVAVVEMLEQHHRPFVVRSIAAQSNAEFLPLLGPFLSSFESLRRWAVVQFSPVEDGYRNRVEFEISDQDYSRTASLCRETYSGGAEVDTYRNSQKGGVYCLVSPAGGVFGRAELASIDSHPIVGDMLRGHLDEIAANLLFDPVRHDARYGHLM